MSRNIEDYTQKYIAEDFETNYQVKYRRKKVLEVMGRYPHGNVLEIGCGMEPLASFCHDFSSWTIVEPSETFFAHARERFREDKRIHCMHGFFEETASRLTGNRFDYIILSSLLHEVDDPGRLLEAVAEVCTKSTVIHVNVPNAKSFHRLLAQESGLIQDVFAFSDMNKKMQQHMVFDLHSLKETLASAFVEYGGAIVLEEGSFFLKPFTHRQMTLCLQHNILDERILMGLEGMAKYLPELASEIYVNFRIGNTMEESDGNSGRSSKI